MNKAAGLASGGLLWIDARRGRAPTTGHRGLGGGGGRGVHSEMGWPCAAARVIQSGSAVGGRGVLTRVDRACAVPGLST